MGRCRSARPGRRLPTQTSLLSYACYTVPASSRTGRELLARTGFKGGGCTTSPMEAGEKLHVPAKMPLWKPERRRKGRKNAGRWSLPTHDRASFDDPNICHAQDRRRAEAVQRKAAFQDSSLIFSYGLHVAGCGLEAAGCRLQVVGLGLCLH